MNADSAGLGVVPNLEQCGDLNFSGGTAEFVTLSYVLESQGGWDDPSYHLWRRGERLTENGSLVSDTLYDRSHPLADTIRLAGDTGAFPALLDQAYDAIGFELIPHADSPQVLPSPFSAAEELYMQFWRHIDPPVLDSVRFSALDSTVTLYWENNHWDRTIDSTRLIREGTGSNTASLTRDVDQYVDSPPDTGTYVYRLLHLNQSVTSEWLDIPASDTISDTVRVLWGPTDLGCTRKKVQTKATCGWTNADTTLNTQFFRNDSLRTTLDPGDDQHTDTGLPTTVGAVYKVRHEQDGDVTEFSLPDTVRGWLSVTPSNVVCGGCVVCNWENGSSSYATEIWRSQTSPTQGYAIRDTAAAGAQNYTDTAVDSLVTYWYKLRHVGTFSFGDYSNADSVVACTSEPCEIGR